MEIDWNWWYESHGIDLAGSSDLGAALVEHGTGLFDTWTTLTYQKEPDDFFGKILWYAGVITQLGLSILTMPAGMGAFLMEEAAQSMGMGAFFLYQAKHWSSLAGYNQVYKQMLDKFEITAKALATINPSTAGAVIIYLQTAKMSRAALESSAMYQVRTNLRSLGQKLTGQETFIELVNLLDLAQAEQLAESILEAQTLGTLALKSVPTYADIYIDGRALNVQTPETFKNLPEGPHEIAVSKYNTKTKQTDSYAATIEIEAGRKKEVTLHIPEGTGDDLVNPGGTEKKDTSQLPDFIATQVTVDTMIDGDTFTTNTGEKIRILGMDAPEIGTAIAETSKDWMAAKIEGKKVDVSIQTHLPIDTYGRTLAIVRYRDENVAVSSIAAGMAKALIFDDATYDPAKYQAAEIQARTRKVGIWDPNTPAIIWRGT